MTKKVGLKLTTSWDDGHPLDDRLADLLMRHGARATFYVPGENCEQRDVMSTAALRALHTQFQIGSHTRTHANLKTLTSTASAAEIRSGKAHLENQLGTAVDHFCYPGGGFNNAIAAQVRAAGFRYARTVKSFCTTRVFDPFQMPTTLQVFPHTKADYFRNFLRYGHRAHRAKPFLLALSKAKLVDRLVALAELAHDQNGCLHIWGHSWELEAVGLWASVDEALSVIVGSFDVQHVDNAAETVCKTPPSPQRVVS